MQYQLLTHLSDELKHPLRLADLVVSDVDPTLGPDKVVWSEDPRYEDKLLPNLGLRGDRLHRASGHLTDSKGSPSLREYTGRIMTVDPSGRGEDETGVSVQYFLNGQVFVAKIRGFLGGYDDETMTKIAALAKSCLVREIITEDNFADGMFSKILSGSLLAAGYPCRITGVKFHTQKEQRILRTLEPVMHQHRLIVCASAVRDDYESVQRYHSDVRQSYTFQHQMTRLTRDRGCLLHDDRLDAVAIGVAHWEQYMAQDVEKDFDQFIGRFDQYLQQQMNPSNPPPDQAVPNVWIEEDERGRLVCTDGETEWRYDQKQGCE